jgi:hypothetical protein
MIHGIDLVWTEGHRIVRRIIPLAPCRWPCRDGAARHEPERRSGDVVVQMDGPGTRNRDRPTWKRCDH